MTNNWLDQVYKAVSLVPSGKVVTYGQVATIIGRPRSARMIGWALARLPYGTKIPWQRVVNRKGELSIIHPFVTAQIQADLLKKEHVEVKKIDGVLKINLQKYSFEFKE